jgi:hypothetical protein
MPVTLRMPGCHFVPIRFVPRRGFGALRRADSSATPEPSSYDRTFHIRAFRAARESGAAGESQPPLANQLTALRSQSRVME